MKSIAISKPLYYHQPRNGVGPVYYAAKRFTDIVLSLLGLLIGGPLLLVFGLLIRWESRGPIFYKQVRCGKGGKPFVIYKLRSMNLNAERRGIQWAKKDDSRMTRVGKFIRKTKIDEIPQFFNILTGEMSIIGPRPERPSFVVEFQKGIPNFTQRLQVKPGLTGWAQVNGGYELKPDEKLQYDLYYIHNQSFRLEWEILIKTVRFLTDGKGSW
ncbi:MAG TPA: sugar transferase [Bacillota bacterium]|nr:sugar transferase [Bacillota bacterium]